MSYIIKNICPRCSDKKNKMVYCYFIPKYESEITIRKFFYCHKCFQQKTGIQINEFILRTFQHNCYVCNTELYNWINNCKLPYLRRDDLYIVETNNIDNCFEKYYSILFCPECYDKWIKI